MVKIVLDAGHGGKDPGALANGLKEKDITLALVLKAGAYLTENYQCDVIYTRKEDMYLSPSERARRANEAKADVFCSFHINSAENPSARGFETFRYPKTAGKTAMLQMLVHEKVMNEMKKHHVLNRGMKEENFAVVRETEMPAVLTETLFISNKEDARLLKSESFLDQVACAHAVGIAQAAGAKERTVPAETKTLYRLLTGTFSEREEAEEKAGLLRRAYGWIVHVKEEK
ncbi:N-acetylmuramoyl-L-alanine amidase [Domibacillus mangrovi]|uniref:MurNAc-LAA domain-containing protein n=1 Tax=Domibacillus mangrovi TaxID=1714354 RepID=A0A1Q5NZE7_9BACI|nr:N-acetylmuramoyl-L-alanine amidase [Domibacillus mangrovi]OKL35331.1 hypothetical protein BLL40_15845 [Domibacillus mangrovi]